MSIHVHIEQAPPKTWQQFEELCADVFAAAWSDPAMVRHGRGGQAQHGVDIYGRCGNQWPVGLQCKRKSRWPVTKMTTADIDNEVAEARKFRPKLKSFYILTTAPNDAALQEHVRLITARHVRRGLFDVHVLGWEEICRRATLYPAVADKHFGAGGIGSREPLLATWYASGGRLELKGAKLAVTCRELAHEFRERSGGRLVLRQRESDDLAAALAASQGRTLSVQQRRAQLALRDKLANQQEGEARISRGLTLLLGDPAIASWIFTVYRDTSDAVCAVTGFVNHELDPEKAFVKDGTIRLRVRAPRHPDIWQSHYISRAQVSSILRLKQARSEKFGPGGHTETVDELPEQIRGGEAIPAVISAILRQLDDGQSLEELRKMGILEIGSWRAELG